MVIEEDKHDLFIYFNIKQTKNTIWIKIVILGSDFVDCHVTILLRSVDKLLSRYSNLRYQQTWIISTTITTGFG